VNYIVFDYSREFICYASSFLKSASAIARYETTNYNQENLH
jgi:hypothetical protein